MKRNIEKELHSIRHQELSEREREVLWNRIENEYGEGPILSPLSPLAFISFMTNHHTMKKALVAVLIVFVGFGGVAYASDSARPGDALYPLDRAIENLRLAVASAENEPELRVRFATERVEELTSLIREDASGNSTGASGTRTTATTTSAGVLEAEADIFTNETIVKVELGDAKQFATTTATSTDAIGSFIVTLLDDAVTLEEVLAVLSVEVEDRASRPDDFGFTERKRERVNQSLEDTLASLSELSEVFADNPDRQAQVDALLESVNGVINTIPEDELGKFQIRVRNENLDFKLKTNGTAQTQAEIKTRSEGDTPGIKEKVKVKIKNGEVRIEREIEDEDDDNSGRGNIEDRRGRDDDDDEDADDRDDDNRGRGNGRDDDDDEDEDEERGRDRDDDDEDEDDRDEDETTDNDDTTGTSTDDGTADQGTGDNDTATSTDDGTTTDDTATSTDDGTTDQGSGDSDTATSTPAN